MKASFAVASLLAGAVTGAVAVEAIQAQTKPPVYFVFNNELTNKDGYIKEYLPKALPTIKAHGGRIIAAGKPTAMSGEPPKESAGIIVWESMEQLQAWIDSPEYREARAIGEKYAKYQNFVIPGVPQ